jgi:hypothetical protein
MHPKAEKLALFRYGLIAPLVLEPLPRGELIGGGAKRLSAPAPLQKELFVKQA